MFELLKGHSRTGNKLIKYYQRFDRTVNVGLLFNYYLFYFLVCSQTVTNNTTVNGNAISPVVSSPGAKPVPPPRDHLRIEKDGRLVNRAPAPQVPARIVNNNNVVATTPVSISKTEPTKEQLDSIRKFQVSQIDHQFLTWIQSKYSFILTGIFLLFLFSDISK